MAAPALLCILLCISAGAYAQSGTIPAFPLEQDWMTITRQARPGTPFDKAGRRAAVLGEEGGTFEAWAYPLKLIRNAEISFLLGSSSTPLPSREVVRSIEVTPAATTITYAHQAFTVRETFFTPFDRPGALILLEVDAAEPLTIVCSFLSVLQPMWPAGLGGQYASWDGELHAYLISEPTQRNHGYFGSPAAAGLSYTPAHMLSDLPSQFAIPVPDPDAVRGRFIPIAIAGGKGARDSVRAAYRSLLADPEALYRSTVAHCHEVQDSTLQVATGEPLLDLAFAWGKSAYDNLLVDNPDLGRGMVAGLASSGSSARPGFGWFFGGDAYINALSLDGIGAYPAVREAIAFTRKWQRDDGKMAHELSQAAAYVNWFKDYPYAYLHGDTSPLYIVAVEDLFRMTADTGFVLESWPSLVKAFRWCRSTDADGDALMDNGKAGLGASEYGALTEVQSDIYTSAVWVRALQAMTSLAGAAGDPATGREASALLERASRAWDQRFWDERRRHYAYAFDATGNQVALVSPWSSVGLMWNLGEPGRSALALRELNGAPLTTDWGIRSIAKGEPQYEPLNYNYGAVWPFLSSWVAAAQYVHHNSLQGYHLLMANARHTFDNAAGCITELFSGNQNIWPAEGVPHQGFSTAGVMLPLVRGLLGLEADAPRRRATFAPQFPASWDSVRVGNWRVGGAVLGFTYARSESTVTVRCSARHAGGYTLRLAPSLGPGSEVLLVLVNGTPAPWRRAASEASLRPEIEVPAREGTVVRITYRPGFELLPPSTPSSTGDADRGVKVIGADWADGAMRITLEGLAGSTADLPLWNPGAAGSVEGGSLIRGGIQVVFPAGPRGEFARTTIVVHARR